MIAAATMMRMKDEDEDVDDDDDEYLIEFAGNDPTYSSIEY